MNAGDIFEEFRLYNLSCGPLKLHQEHDPEDEAVPDVTCACFNVCSDSDDTDRSAGPDGLRDYKPHLVDDTQPIGVGCLSEQETISLGYLFRPAPSTPFPRPRSWMPGAYGWGIPDLADWGLPRSGQQIAMGDMRQQAEDRCTHQLLGAWYPSPGTSTPVGSGGFNKENIYSGRPGTANVRYLHSACDSPAPFSSRPRPATGVTGRGSYTPNRPPPSSVRITNVRGDGVWSNPNTG